MAKPQTRSETALQSAVMRFGDDAFRICYMHTKSGKETLTLLSDVFMQYFLDTQTFKSESEERLWVLRTTHKTCMDYYAQKIRKKLTDEQIAQRSKDMPFETPKELCDILRLHYTLLTAVALHYGAGDNTRFIGRVTGKSASAVQNQLEKAKKAANMSEDDLREWVETLETPDDLLHRVYYSVLNESKDPHFTANSRAKRLKRNIDRAMPFAAVGVIVICLLCVVAVRAGWFGTKYVRTPDVILESDTPVSSAAESEVSHVTLTPEPTASEDTREAVNMSLSIFVPSDSGLDQYSYKSLPADGAVLVQKMAEKGAFPEDVTLDALDYIKDGEVVSTMKSGEMLEVRLQFSGALQEYLDSASSTSSLEAIAKTFRAFYEAAGMTLSKLEVYSDGKPVTVPTQDMILGAYYLTYTRLGKAEKGAETVFVTDPGDTDFPVNEIVDADEFVAANKAAKAAGKAIAKFRPIHNYSSVNEAIAAYAAGTVGLHAPIRVRYGKKIDGEMRYRIIDATVGRLIYNEPIPQDLGFVDRTVSGHEFDLEVSFLVGKKQLGKIIDKCIRRHGFTIATEMLDRIKALGYKYSTKGAISVSIADMVVPSVKYEMVHSAEKKVVEIEHFYRQGYITNDERYRLVVQQWEKTTADVTNALQGSMDEFNPIYMMADSGARGSMAQIRQLAGMRGLMADTAGRTIEIPVKANFREGLSVLEYFISSRGARKGMTDTALRTADSGYLTRRMVDVSQDVIIREHNCGTTNGIWVGAVYDKNGDVIDTFGNRIRGRYPVHDVVDPQTGELLHSKDVMMMPEDAEKFEQHGINKIYIRTILGCRARVGVCAKCYGMNLATSKEVDLGEAVGIIAAQSIGEPGTQLTMRTFHSGGVAGDDITQGLPRVEELFEARRPKKMAQISEITGVVSVDETHRTALRNITVTADDGEVKVYQVPYSVGLKVAHGKVVEKGQPITDGALYPQDVLRISGVEAVQDYLVQSVQAVYRQQGVEINDKHIEVIIRQMMRKVRVEDPGDTALLTGSAIDSFEFEDANAEIQRRIDAGETELRPATASAMLLGITKAALATDSFLSAASFQETTKVLTDAAIKGKVDHLVGLKENVLIGKLIPAGSGLMAYRDYQPGATPEARIPEEMIENALN